MTVDLRPSTADVSARCLRHCCLRVCGNKTGGIGGAAETTLRETTLKAHYYYCRYCAPWSTRELPSWTTSGTLENAAGVGFISPTGKITPGRRHRACKTLALTTSRAASLADTVNPSLWHIAPAQRPTPACSRQTEGVYQLREAEHSPTRSADQTARPGWIVVDPLTARARPPAAALAFARTSTWATSPSSAVVVNPRPRRSRFGGVLAWSLPEVIAERARGGPAGFMEATSET